MENGENMTGNLQRPGRHYLDTRADILKLPYHLAQCAQSNKEEEYKCVLKKLQYLKRLRDLVGSVDSRVSPLSKAIKDQQYAKIKETGRISKDLR